MTMRTPVTQEAILAGIVKNAQKIPDHTISSITWGVCLSAVQSAQTGLASLVSHIAPKPGTVRPDDGPGKSAHQTALTLLDPKSTMTDHASLAMAAINSLLPPPPKDAELPGQDMLLQLGKGKKMAIIGHFPFVDALRKVCQNCWVLERQPKEGDLIASEAPTILPQADIITITGTTLLNGTLAELLNLCREDATAILLGPTTPFAPSLFGFGIDILAGSEVVDPEAVLSGIRGGSCFKGLQGVKQTSWARPGLNL